MTENETMHDLRLLPTEAQFSASEPQVLEDPQTQKSECTRQRCRCPDHFAAVDMVLLQDCFRFPVTLDFNVGKPSSEIEGIRRELGLHSLQNGCNAGSRNDTMSASFLQKTSDGLSRNSCLRSEMAKRPRISAKGLFVQMINGGLRQSQL